MKFIRGLASDSSGVTGLETAVVLLSFFVVASVLGISVTKMGQATSSGSTQVVAEQLTESVPILKPEGTGLVMAIRTLRRAAPWPGCEPFHSRPDGTVGDRPTHRTTEDPRRLRASPVRESPLLRPIAAVRRPPYPKWNPGYFPCSCFPHAVPSVIRGLNPKDWSWPGDGQTYPHHVSAIVVPLITYSAAPVKLNREQIVISYYDGRQYAQDLPWTARWIRGDSHEDNLDPEELVEVVVELSSLDPKLREHTNFTLEFKLLQGAITRIEPSTPARLDPVSALSY